MTTRKAIIPAAGKGTRLRPATLAVPKELFPVGGKPVIQWVVEEAIRAGITEIAIIISEEKEIIKKHFELLDEEAIKNIRIEFIYQEEQKGLGHAILQAKDFTGEEPFMVLLGDCIIDDRSVESTLAKMVKLYNANEVSIVAIERKEKDLLHNYGVMQGEQMVAGLYKVIAWVEKPKIGTAPSDLVVAGRYLFTPNIWNHLGHLPAGINNEIQLTDAMHALAQNATMYGLELTGARFDIGSWQGYLDTIQRFHSIF